MQLIYKFYQNSRVIIENFIFSIIQDNNNHENHNRHKRGQPRGTA